MPLKVKYYLFLILFIISTYSFAQVVEGGDKPSQKKLLSEMTKESLTKELESFKNKEIKILEEEIGVFNKKVSYYIQNRDRECKGDFSSIEINSKGESEIVKRKLNKDEIKLCHLELINFRKKYVSEIFKVRKQILLEQQKKQLENLEDIRLKSIMSLDQIANKLSN